MSLVRAEEPEPGLHLLTLEDPDRRNAMGPAMAAELKDAITAASAAQGLRMLAVTGAGGAFCAGADLPAMFDAPDRPVPETRDFLRGYYDAFLALRDVPAPTVAAVDGPAVGAGLNLALACDVRIVSERAKLGATFAKIGLHPGGGCTWFLVKALGPQRTLQLLADGETLDAATACELGLADGPVDDPVARVRAWYGELADRDTRLLRDLAVTTRLAADGASLDTVVEHEAWCQAASTESETLAAWVAKFR